MTSHPTSRSIWIGRLVGAVAMLALFGAPHLVEILRGYDEAHPLREGWRDRVPLHQLHPLATHSAGHGAGYAVALADAARQVLRR